MQTWEQFEEIILSPAYKSDTSDPAQVADIMGTNDVPDELTFWASMVMWLQNNV